MKCAKCTFWYCSKCYNTNKKKDALDESCASFIPFNKGIYIAIKNGNTAFIQTKEEGAII